MGTSNETAAPPPGEGLTFEKVWASLMELKEFQRESARRMEARSAETDQILEESARRRAETDRILERSARQIEKTARQMKETDKRVGAITNRFGDIVEHMVIPNLVSGFQELGFTFTRSGNLKIADKEHNIFLEIDALLENGDKAMVVEIKTKPNNDDINDHLERMKKMRIHADLRNDKRTYLGAVAGVVFGEGVKTYALRNGFYVLEPSGETFIITEPRAEGFTPGVW
jgi:hypothetical protein